MSSKYTALQLVLLLTCIFYVSSRNIKPNENFESKIIGGSEAPDGAYPYMISLQESGDHWCGGSIIHSEWILTAAHCLIRKKSIENYMVVVGTNNWKVGGTAYPIEELVVHENYTHNPEHDIALLRVKPIVFSDKVKLILVEPQFIDGGELSVISGWGLTFFPGEPSDVPDMLQHISVKTDTNEHCSAVHGIRVPQSDICTLAEKGQGTCFSDSGSPVVWNNNGELRQIGMVIWMSGPCGNGEPNGHNRISYYYEWIKRNCNNCI